MAPGKKVGPPARYQLYGGKPIESFLACGFISDGYLNPSVLYHHGLSASGGHYTLDVLHPNRDGGVKPREGWIRIDDELVSDVRQEDVFSGLDRDDRCAYLLFYRRLVGGGRA